MSSLALHLLLVLAGAALAAASLRGAAALGANGSTRLLAALPIAATAAAVSSLLLGLVELGTDPFALTAAGVGVWLLARRWLPAPSRRLSDELSESWQGLDFAYRVAIGSIAGAGIAVATWTLINPAFTGDGLHYHAPAVIAWVSGGDPPSLNPVSTDAPLEAYPLTAELLAAWAAGISQSLATIGIWNPAMLMLVGLAGWCGLRGVGVSRLASLLAVAAVVTSPLLVGQLNTFTTDIPALAWLTCCAALCACSPRAPGLLAVAVLAAGLAIGTKTTTAPLALVCLTWTAVGLRGQLRALLPLLAAASIAAVAVGGIWYLRNLVLHGSPLWPFASSPWGDPQPAVFEAGNERLIADPGSAGGRLDDYWRFLRGDLVLLVGGVAAALIAPSRRLFAASAVTAIAFVIWTSAPFTAFPDEPVFDGLQAGSTRYLLPAVVAGALALALAASAPGRRARLLAAGLLAAALAANLIGIGRLGFTADFQPVVALEVDPVLPSLLVPAAGALVAAGLVFALEGFRAPPRLVGTAVAVPIAAAAAFALLLTLGGSGYSERIASQPPNPPGAAWLLDQPGYRDGDAPVAFQGRVIAPLAGDRFRHPLQLLTGTPGCSAVEAAHGRGWVVVPISPEPAASSATPPEFEQIARRNREAELAVGRCLAAREPAYVDAQLAIYAPGG